MSDYRGGPLNVLTQIFLEVLHKACENDPTFLPSKYVDRWNKEIKYLNKVLTTRK